MAINPNDPAFAGTGPGINVRTYLTAVALSGRMSKELAFTAEDAVGVVKAADLVIAELNKGGIAISTGGTMGAASSSGNQTLNVGGASGVVVRRGK